MAPERIQPLDPQKPDYDIRADVWSLGVTLVGLLLAVKVTKFLPIPHSYVHTKLLTVDKGHKTHCWVFLALGMGDGFHSLVGIVGYFIVALFAIFM